MKLQMLTFSLHKVRPLNIIMKWCKEDTTQLKKKSRSRKDAFYLHLLHCYEFASHFLVAHELYKKIRFEDTFLYTYLNDPFYKKLRIGLALQFLKFSHFRELEVSYEFPNFGIFGNFRIKSKEKLFLFLIQKVSLILTLEGIRYFLIMKMKDLVP